MLGPDFGKRGDERGVSEAAGACPAFEAIAFLEEPSRDDTGRPRQTLGASAAWRSRGRSRRCLVTNSTASSHSVFWSKSAISVLYTLERVLLERA